VLETLAAQTGAGAAASGRQRRASKVGGVEPTDAFEREFQKVKEWTARQAVLAEDHDRLHVIEVSELFICLCRRKYEGMHALCGRLLALNHT